MGAALHDNLEKEHRESRESVNNSLCGVLSVDHRCSLDSWCVLESGLVMSLIAAL